MRSIKGLADSADKTIGEMKIMQGSAIPTEIFIRQTRDLIYLSKDYMRQTQGRFQGGAVHYPPP